MGGFGGGHIGGLGGAHIGGLGGAHIGGSRVGHTAGIGRHRFDAGRRRFAGRGFYGDGYGCPYYDATTPPYFCSYDY
jgi:hypothetical protein